MNNYFKKACTSDNANFDSTTSAYNPSGIAGPKYECGVCGTMHDTIEDRAKCEMACLKKQEEERKLAAEKKKKEEKAARKKEVDDAIKHTQELINKYTADYGVYKMHPVVDFDDSFRTLLRMLP